jgi:glycosyltransferase involved in cell wall biosynthesis
VIERLEMQSTLPALEPQNQRVFCIIPTYRASKTIVSVVSEALNYADAVVVVDDCCPEDSASAAIAAYHGNPNVHVLRRETNGGVGAATKTGIGFAIEHDADIVVKLDADGQMDAKFIGSIRALFAEDPSLVCIKGNRFFDASIIDVMPKVRFFGNAVLSLLAKCASGYWNTIDPTNGYVAFNAQLLKVLPWRDFADSYFFEMSVLCELGLKRLPILELEMPTIYTSAPSSLSISRVMREFPPRLLRLMLRRLLVQYFVFDVNLGTIYFVCGFLLALFGTVFGVFEWFQGRATGLPVTTGTIMLAVLPFLMGFQLLLNALMYDVQFSQKTHHELEVGLRRRFHRR